MIPYEALREFGFFEQLTDGELMDIAVLCHKHCYDEGATCFVQGREATEFHLCRSGRVDIIVKLGVPWDIEATVHTITGGEILGWSALVRPYIYTASAKCIERTQDIYINGSDLRNLFKGRHRMAYEVMTNLSAVISSRLTETRLKLAEAVARAVQ